MSRKNLSVILIVVFLLTMVMGSGPGIRLINPDLSDPHASFMFLGLPRIYIWGLFWYAVQLAVIMIAYFKIWKRDV